MAETPRLIEDDEHVASPERRTLLRKVVYAAPVVVVLGVATHINKAFAWSGRPPGDPASPEQYYESGR